MKVDTGIFESQLGRERSDGSYDTFRGFLLAALMGLPIWAALIAICCWIWL